MNEEERNDIYRAGFLDGQAFEAEKIYRDLFEISVCYFPKRTEVEMTIENNWGGEN